MLCRMATRNFSILCATALLLILPCAAQPGAQGARLSPSEAEDRQAIEQLHQADIEGNLAFDIDKLAGTWDDEVVTIPPHSAPIKGIEANRAYLEAQRKTMANIEILSYDQSWNEVRLLGDYAYEWGVIHSRIRPVNSTKELDLEFNIMRILKRQPSGAWKIYRSIWNDRKPANTQPAPPEEKPRPELQP